MLFFPTELASRHPHESPFYLRYGRNPWLPGDAVLSTPEGYRSETLQAEMSQHFVEAWKLAQCQVEKSQKSQNEYYDRGTVNDKVHIGDRVFVYTPSEKKGKVYKFACPYVGLYRILEAYDNGARLKHIRKPNSQPIRVALNRVMLCVQPRLEIFLLKVEKMTSRLKWNPMRGCLYNRQ